MIERAVLVVHDVVPDFIGDDPAMGRSAREHAARSCVAVAHDVGLPSDVHLRATGPRNGAGLRMCLRRSRMRANGRARPQAALRTFFETEPGTTRCGRMGATRSSSVASHLAGGVETTVRGGLAATATCGRSSSQTPACAGPSPIKAGARSAARRGGARHA